EVATHRPYWQHSNGQAPGSSRGNVSPLGGTGWAMAGAGSPRVSTNVSTKASVGEAKSTARSYTGGPCDHEPVKLALYAGLVLAALLVVSLATFWLAVRPPRLAIALRPDDYRLRVEDVTIRADDGVRLAGWFTPRPGAPAIVLLHGYPAEK